MVRERESSRLEPLSIPLSVDEALRDAMTVDPLPIAKPKKQRKAKKKGEKTKELGCPYANISSATLE